MERGLNVGLREIGASKEQRHIRNGRGRVGQTVSEIQCGWMPSLAITQERGYRGVEVIFGERYRMRVRIPNELDQHQSCIPAQTRTEDNPSFHQGWSGNANGSSV